MSYHVGEAKGQAEEKASNLMEKASNAAQSAKETVQETGQQMMVKAQEAVKISKMRPASTNEPFLFPNMYP